MLVELHGVTIDGLYNNRGRGDFGRLPQRPAQGVQEKKLTDALTLIAPVNSKTPE